ncbi:hypothetical protein BDZ97DRAFT_359830 [Flammula alnicola]|nr:hypothetical protein BDZ97DRAFT_359830 [Flammula alnicola]
MTIATRIRNTYPNKIRISPREPFVLFPEFHPASLLALDWQGSVIQSQRCPASRPMILRIQPPTNRTKPAGLATIRTFSLSHIPAFQAGEGKEDYYISLRPCSYHIDLVSIK